jgi:hypothetical protein
MELSKLYLLHYLKHQNGLVEIMIRPNSVVSDSNLGYKLFFTYFHC